MYCAPRTNEIGATEVPAHPFVLPSSLPALVRRRKAQAAAVLDCSRALPQRDGCIRPAFAGRVKGGKGKLIVLNARDVLDEAISVRLRPYINAVGEMCARLRCFLHRHFFLPHSSSSSRFTAGASAFLIFTPWLVRVPPQSAQTLHLHF